MSVRLLVYGDLHGRIEPMLRHALRYRERTGERIDALLQVGDFGADRVDPPPRSRSPSRSRGEGGSAAAPLRYRGAEELRAYAAGERRVPLPTLFIGGNHEPWDALPTAPEGGEVAPGLRYLGRSGAVEIGGVRIAGLTGIHSPRAFDRELPRPPDATWRYYRRDAVEALRSGPRPDVLLLHDWPRPLSDAEIEEARGAPPYLLAPGEPSPTRELLERLEPAYAVFGHLHGARLRARLGRTRLLGLSRFRPDDPGSWGPLRLEG